MTVRAVSVILLVFDRPALVEQAINAFALQTYDGPIEIVVTDDGSEPSLADMVCSYSSRLAVDVRYARQAHRGFRASRARNNGLKLADGDLAILVDGDQVVPPGFVAAHVAAHRCEKILGVGPMKRVPITIFRSDVGATLASANDFQGGGGFPERQAHWAQSPHPWMAVLSGNISVRRGSEVRFNEGFVGWGGEDREFGYRLWSEGYRVEFLPAAISYHLSEPRGLLHKTADELAAFVRNRLLLLRCHPAGDLGPAMDVLRRFHFDRVHNRWGLLADGAPDADPSEVLELARAEWPEFLS